MRLLRLLRMFRMFRVPNRMMGMLVGMLQNLAVVFAVLMIFIYVWAVIPTHVLGNDEAFDEEFEHRIAGGYVLR